ncbi:MAG TPA: endonuclease NucS [Candidatus Thermoplasmatota archaeon]|nr:endonuclease NucS [Candidatus Thermoplasmatota archaeon]
MQVVRDPEPAAALAFLQGELKALHEGRGRLIEVVGECQVEYKGRARSHLSRGERLVLVKPDGTLLIHSAAKAKPVNWQPPGATFQAAMEEGRVVLTAYRAKPEELVRIAFHAVRLLAAVPLRDGADLALLGSEDDLQALLFERPDLVEPGFRPRRRERDATHGTWDLDGDDAKGRRLVVEVKRATAGVGDAQQLWRYVEDLRKTNPAARGLLVAPKVAPKARKLLADHALEWRELDLESLLPQVEAMRRGGQASLGTFG